MSQKKSFLLIDSSVFYRMFHGHKTIKDFVRRRRWTRWAHFASLGFCSAQFLQHLDNNISTRRKCKITLQAPWKQVPPIRLSDISLMPCLAQSKMEQVPVWALSDKGDVLCRLGVSLQNPAVRNVLRICFIGSHFTLLTISNLTGSDNIGQFVAPCGHRPAL